MTAPTRAAGSLRRQIVVALIAVVLLAKVFALVVATAVVATGSPPGVTGVIIALLVLTPEGISAIHAARRDDLQKSLNLALGSSLATISLTIPAMALAAGLLDKQIELGLNTREMVLLITTLGTSYLTLSTGARTCCLASCTSCCLACTCS